MFKKGDKVFDYKYGWGQVSNVYDNVYDNSNFPISVLFVGDGVEVLEVSYTRNGQEHIDANPTLSFTEYITEGFTQERPSLENELIDYLTRNYYREMNGSTLGLELKRGIREFFEQKGLNE